MGKARGMVSYQGLPTAAERLVWGHGDGSTLTAVETPWGPMGAVICWENYVPLLRMAMYSKGPTLYCAPTADDRDTSVPSMQHVALEGASFCRPASTSPGASIPATFATRLRTSLTTC